MLYIKLSPVELYKLILKTLNVSLSVTITIFIEQVLWNSEEKQWKVNFNTHSLWWRLSLWQKIVIESHPPFHEYILWTTMWISQFWIVSIRQCDKFYWLPSKQWVSVPDDRNLWIPSRQFDSMDRSCWLLVAKWVSMFLLMVHQVTLYWSSYVLALKDVPHTGEIRIGKVIFVIFALFSPGLSISLRLFFFSFWPSAFQSLPFGPSVYPKAFLSICTSTSQSDSFVYFKLLFLCKEVPSLKNMS